MEGHTIGTHSEDHPLRFGQLSVEKIRHEIDWGISDVAAALGGARYLAPFFRIPGLARSDVLENELAARGLVVFSSDADADDWHRHIKPDQIIALAMGRLEALGKGILLLHHIPPWSVAELDASFVVRPGEFEATLRFKRRGESGIKAGAHRSCLETGRSMPRYFFTIHGQDRVADDPEGTYLPDEAAALSYTEYTIRELRKKSGYNDLALMMFVEDEARQTILALPFFPGC